ncbi:MAG TPA: glycosyltransferase family 9 protein, partial [Verrucomicrobiae bacterium]|nr:glycosyltransferase family 9 protein [Verrucomicrobiae bacterium]
MKARGKILIIRGGAIGDFILTLPAIAALRKQFPETHLEILGYPHIAQLALAANLVDAVKSIDASALAGFFARNGNLSAPLTEYFSQFNVIISYLYDPDLIFQKNIESCSRANFIVGPHRPDELKKIHATKVFLRPLEQLAIYGVDEVPRLDLVPETVPARRLALHPGSGSDKKNWPEANWALLIQQILSSTDLNLLIVGGEAEGERLQRLAAALPHLRVTVAQSLPLPE